MRRISLFIFLIIFFYISSAYAFISVTDLIENAKENDLKEVAIKGEVIGDIFHKGDFVWINVSDGVNAIGIWVPEKSVAELSHPGDYSHKGDFVQITGRFNRACIEHMGETDIHLDNFCVLKKGESVSHPVDNIKLKTTIGVFLLAVILLGVELFLRKRAKENESEG
ncbi:MAG: DNA-binding protein [bacterium]|nr:DNA-binding protein [bacterium]